MVIYFTNRTSAARGVVGGTERFDEVADKGGFGSSQTRLYPAEHFYPHERFSRAVFRFMSCGVEVINYSRIEPIVRGGTSRTFRQLAMPESRPYACVPSTAASGTAHRCRPDGHTVAHRLRVPVQVR